jgi:hypothetical protein
MKNKGIHKISISLLYPTLSLINYTPDLTSSLLRHKVERITSHMQNGGEGEILTERSESGELGRVCWK